MLCTWFHRQKVLNWNYFPMKFQIWRPQKQFTGGTCCWSWLRIDCVDFCRFETFVCWPTDLKIALHHNFFFTPKMQSRERCTGTLFYPCVSFLRCMASSLSMKLQGFNNDFEAERCRDWWVQPSTLYPPPSTLHTLNPQPSTLTPQPRTLNSQPSTLSPQPSTLNPKPQAPNLKP